MFGWFCRFILRSRFCFLRIISVTLIPKYFKFLCTLRSLWLAIGLHQTAILENARIHQLLKPAVSLRFTFRSLSRHHCHTTCCAEAFVCGSGSCRRFPEFCSRFEKAQKAAVSCRSWNCLPRAQLFVQRHQLRESLNESNLLACSQSPLNLPKVF